MNQRENHQAQCYSDNTTQPMRGRPSKNTRYQTAKDLEILRRHSARDFVTINRNAQQITTLNEQLRSVEVEHRALAANVEEITRIKLQLQAVEDKLQSADVTLQSTEVKLQSLSRSKKKRLCAIL